jgi:pyruvate dehydrogenase E2 component (dihydrolipoamide acetyltransferase)
MAGEGHEAVLATPKARALARAMHLDLAAIAGSGPDGRVQALDVQVLAAAEIAGAAQPVPVKATPLARKIAASQGVDLRKLQGSGIEGMVTRADVEQALHQQALLHQAPAQTPERTLEQPQARPHSAPAPQPVPAEGAGRLVPHSVLRRTIAERMSQSAFTAPHVTLTTEAEATNLVSARAQLNQELPAEEKIGYNALLAALTARALAEHVHAGLNARWEAEGIRLLDEINIALAVDTERGLMTPVLHAVNKLSIVAVQRGYAALTARALAGKSLPDDFAGGTFTITNLGAAEIDAFTPIINPPQAAILGVGRIVEKPVARDGAVVIRPMMVLSLSFDHRVVDGGPAARFLQRVKQLVERPMALLL